MPLSRRTIDFLLENRLRDSREWFAEHRGDYERDVLNPLVELAAQLAPRMLEIDSGLTTEPRVDKTICRIRRDTRFSRDRSLYRDTMWIIWKRGKMHGAGVPGFYFEITPGGFGYGCGFYDASPDYMETMRGMILSGDPVFLRALERYRSQEVYRMEGVCYKRPHFPDQREELREWIERRNISFEAESAEWDLLISDRLAARLVRDFELLSPVYRFLLHAAFGVTRGG